MEIVPQSIFPSMVWSTLFDDREEFNKNLLQQIYKLKEDNPQGVANTNIRGWQSPNDIQTLEAFKDINLRIIQVCQAIGQSQHFAPGLTFKHQAWVNINPPGASNKIHYHANCHFSGIYYISLKAPECGSIFFRDPRVASRMMTFPATQPTEFTSEEVRMKPEEGRMYVFPGWLEHGVEENKSDQDRISIAFNVLATAGNPD